MRIRAFKPPSRVVVEAAKAALRALPAQPKGRIGVVRVRTAGSKSGKCKETTIVISIEAAEVLQEILGQMAQVNAVQVVTAKKELTTREVADLLSVSRPYVVGLLEQQKIPSRKVGARRRVRVEDALAYKADDDRRREQVLAELAAAAQKQGLGY